VLEQELLKLKDVLKIVPVSKTTWYTGMKDGRYPQPVKIGLKAVAWRKEDIENYLSSLNEEKTRKDLKE
jgi:predicted DNA-binding transcriptional regulator AlpA